MRDCKLIRGKWARPVLDAGKVAWMPLSMFDQVTGEKLYSVTID